MTSAPERVLSLHFSWCGDTFLRVLKHFDSLSSGTVKPAHSHTGIPRPFQTKAFVVCFPSFYLITPFQRSLNVHASGHLEWSPLKWVREWWPEEKGGWMCLFIVFSSYACVSHNHWHILYLSCINNVAYLDTRSVYMYVCGGHRVVYCFSIRQNKEYLQSEEWMYRMKNGSTLFCGEFPVCSLPKHSSKMWRKWIKSCEANHNSS